MAFLKKILSSSILSLLVLVHCSCVYHLFGLGDSGFIITTASSIGDCSLSDYHCEKIDEKKYLCERNSQISSNSSFHIREIPSNPSSSAGLFAENGVPSHTLEIPQKLGNLYRSPEDSKYPFVRIIKIQV